MSSQNESPFGNPRFIITVIATFFALWGWQYYINKTYPQNTKATAPAVEPAKTTSIDTNKNDKQTQESGTVKTKPTEAADKSDVEKTFAYEDDNIKWQISSRGMGLNQVELKNYLDKNKNPVMFGTDDKLFSFYVDGKIVNFELKKVSETEFIGTSNLGDSSITRKIQYNKTTKSFDSVVELGGSFNKVGFFTNEKQHLAKSGNFLVPSFDFQNFLYKEKEKVKTEDILHRKADEAFNMSIAAAPLAAISSQYFTQSIVDKSEVLPSVNMSVAASAAKLDIAYNLKDTEIKKVENKIYIGPKVSENLAQIDSSMTDLMDYGIFGFIAKPLLVLMKFLFSIFGNWGVAIIALTLIVRLVMLPFNIVSFKSARAMQKIQPQLQAVREKYKNDPMAVNRETMALMKEHNANPLSSCLPMLIQIPIFFALWKTIGSSIEIYQQPFFWWITDLSSHDKFFVLPVLMGATMYFQQKLTPTTMDPMQAKILNFMPIIFSVFMLSLPSGLTLYNFVSSLFGVIQQYFLLKDNAKK